MQDLEIQPDHPISTRTPLLDFIRKKNLPSENFAVPVNVGMKIKESKKKKKKKKENKYVDFTAK